MLTQNSVGMKMLLVFSLTLSFGLGLRSANAQRTSRERRARAGGATVNKAATRDNAAPVSVAVLPFSNSPQDPETATLGTGIADSLTNALKSVSVLTVLDMDVIAEAAAQFSQNTNRDDAVLEIGRRLGVQILIVGSYQRFGNQIRVDARLLSVNLNRPLPGEAINVTASYPDEYSALLNQLAVRVTDAMRVNVGRAESNRMQETLNNTSSLEAQTLYIQGLESMREESAGALGRAIDLFAAAIAKDSNYALAYAAKADAESRLYEVEQSTGPEAASLGRDALRDATSAVNKAPNSGRGYRALARAQRALGNYSAAAASAQRAIERWPNDASAYLELARARGQGRLIRSAALDRALQLQPGLVLLLQEFPKVLIMNNSSYDLRVQFIPSSGAPYPIAQVAPNSMRIVALLPGQFEVVAQNSLGEKRESYNFEAGQEYKLIYNIIHEEIALQPGDATLIFENTERFTVRVQVSGVQNLSFVVSGGQTKSFQLPPGTYTITVIPGARRVRTATESYTLEAGGEQVIRYYVRR